MELGTFSTGRNGKVDRFENKARERRSFADFPKVPVGMMSRIYIYVYIQRSIVPIDWHERLRDLGSLRLQDLRCLLGHFRGSHVSKYFPRSSYTGSAGGKPALLPQGALHSSFKTDMKQLNIQKGLDSDFRQKYMYIMYIYICIYVCIYIYSDFLLYISCV